MLLKAGASGKVAGLRTSVSDQPGDRPAMPASPAQSPRYAGGRPSTGLGLRARGRTTEASGPAAGNP